MAQDGVEALAILRRTGDFVNSVGPDIILLDLNHFQQEVRNAPIHNIDT